MRGAAFNTGPEYHALDHIAPLAEFLQIPLIVTEEKNRELAGRYYPQVRSRYIPDLECHLGEIAEEFDVLFECKYWAPHLKTLFQTLYKKEIRLVFCPHGQSDKGYQAPLLAPYAAQDVVLLYGELLQRMLKDLGIWPSVRNFAFVGNYRLQFYKKYQVFYDRITTSEIPLNRTRKTLLYAPTWKDADGSTSFFQQASQVIAQVPDDWNLLLKVHPLLEQRDPAQFYRIAFLAEKKKNVYWIDAFPSVYPLLKMADAYLGDASSIGYDFLYFGKPLYFFPAKQEGRLRSCGKVLDPSQNLFLQMEEGNPFAQKQQELYQYAFGEKRSEESFRNAIFTALKAAQPPVHAAR